MAAIELTGEKGLNALTMSSIAKRAKIASGTLYIYFDSKEQLLNELHEHLMLKGTLSLLPSIAHLPLKQQMLTIWSNVLKFRMSNNSEVVFMHEFRYSPLISNNARELDEKFEGYVMQLLNAGKKEFIIKEMDNDLLFPLLYGYIDNLARHLTARKVKLTEAIITKTFGICWDAIKS